MIGKEKKDCNILITSAGRRTALVQGFMNVLHGDGESRGKLITIDMDNLSSALFFSDNYYIVPGATDERYVDILLDICKREKINMLIPTTDIELVILSSKKDIFECAGVKVLVSSFDTIDLCDDKSKTANFFVGLDLRVPLSADGEEKDKLAQIPYPRIMKKKKGGHGSINQFKVCDEEEFVFYQRYFDDLFVQEFVEGTEYTIDVLNNFEGNTISVVPRIRIETRAGVTDKGKTVKIQELIESARKISEELKIIGPCNIQCIKREINFYFTEINPRFSGGILLTIQAGADFPRMLIKMLTGEEVAPEIGNFKENLIVLRHQPGVFIDPNYRVIKK